MTPWEREEEQAEKDLDSGCIGLDEYNRIMRDIQRDYRESAQESALDAYNRELENW